MVLFVFQFHPVGNFGKSFNVGLGTARSEGGNYYRFSVYMYFEWMKVFLYLTDDVQVTLCRHLLRTVCTDMVNQVVGLLAADHMLTVSDESSLLTAEVRNELAKDTEGRGRAVAGKTEEKGGEHSWEAEY